MSFDESKHPRDDLGRWAVSGSSDRKVLKDHLNNLFDIYDYLKGTGTEDLKPSKGLEDPDLVDKIKATDKLLKKYKTPRDLVGYEFASAETLKLSEKGDVFHDPAYLKLGLNKKQFFNDDGSAKHIAYGPVNEVHIPKGTPALIVPKDLGGSVDLLIVHRGLATRLDGPVGPDHVKSTYLKGGYKATEPGLDRLEKAKDYEARKKRKVTMAFDESKHPRDDHGKFTYSGGSVGGLKEKTVRQALNNEPFASHHMRYTARGDESKKNTYGHGKGIDNLDKVIDAHTTDKKIAIRASRPDGADFSKIKVGDTFVDPGYLSGKELTKNEPGGITYHVPEGTHAVKHDANDPLGGQGIIKDKITLHRNSRVRYDGNFGGTEHFSVLTKNRKK